MASVRFHGWRILGFGIHLYWANSIRSKAAWDLEKSKVEHEHQRTTP